MTAIIFPPNVNRYAIKIYILKQVQKKSNHRIKRRPEEETTIEKLHEEYMKKDFVPKEEFQMVRGPRPWEPTDSEWHAARKANKIIKRPTKTKDSYNV